jgi:hypothetical protein
VTEEKTAFCMLNQILDGATRKLEIICVKESHVVHIGIMKRFGENTMNDGIEYKGICSILVQIVSLSSSSLNWPRFLVIYLPLSGLDSSSHLRVPKTIRKIIN